MSMSLCGALWDADLLELDKCLNHADKFERGHEDIFEFRLPPLGDLLSAKIMHDNSGLTNPVRALQSHMTFKEYEQMFTFFNRIGILETLKLLTRGMTCRFCFRVIGGCPEKLLNST